MTLGFFTSSVCPVVPESSFTKNTSQDSFSHLLQSLAHSRCPINAHWIMSLKNSVPYLPSNRFPPQDDFTPTYNSSCHLLSTYCVPGCGIWCLYNKTVIPALHKGN